MTLDNLTPEQKRALLDQLQKEEAEKKERIKTERATYKALVTETVEKAFPLLQQVSAQLSEVKTRVFNDFKTLVEAKKELFECNTDLQNSHTFSSEDGSITISLGYNVNDGWDDTVNVGIEKVKEYLESLVKDESSKALVSAVMRLLVKDTKGNLKASRVLMLKQLAEQQGDKNFLDAIGIIQNAYKPVRSKEYIRCEYKGKDGEKLILPLSITEAKFLVE